MRWLALWLALVPTLEQIRARGRLIVSVKNEGVPQPALHRDPAHFQKRGFEIELARAIAARVVGSADKLELRLLPRRERLPALVAGKVDLVISMIRVQPTPDVAFSVPYFSGGLAMLVRKNGGISKVAGLEGGRAGIVRAHANDPTVEVRRILGERKLDVAIDHFDRIDDAARALHDGKIRAILGQTANLDGWARAHADVRIAGEKLSHDEFAVALRKGDDDLRALVDEVIRKLAQSGELSRMAKKWQLFPDAVDRKDDRPSD
jgi:putative glutamine transport system substrate-binding protein